jgi:hypothetical protein
MGRGRAKAKQTKVARQLKYLSPDTDLDKLRAELTGGKADDEADSADELDDDGYVDPYATNDEDERPAR